MLIPTLMYFYLLEFTPLEFETSCKVLPYSILIAIRIYSVGVWNNYIGFVFLLALTPLEFTPLEFETFKHLISAFFGITIRIYSVGVWNKEEDVSQNEAIDN